MNNRLVTPDIMSNLMSGASEEKSSKKIKQEKTRNKKAIKTANNKPVLRQMLLDGTHEQIEIPEEPKEKATFNLSVKILRELEDSWMEIRRLSRNKQISKTLIVEKALEMALAEFGLKKQIGKLYGKLVNEKK